ncbi:hypothetical protein H2200_011658 [Cladophialophora chaetospira]|uniref:Uncharacterized protein n=1 Tax=Cladophialophora chaetospira TaxID=386627 RepID=A0AA38WZR6_9EURO|nr:hypothetical protein H2200_011658 [Cladophialophora chaetospira]
MDPAFELFAFMLTLLFIIGVGCSLFRIFIWAAEHMDMKRKQKRKLIHLSPQLLSDEELWILGLKVDKERLKRSGSSSIFDRPYADQDVNESPSQGSSYRRAATQQAMTGTVNPRQLLLERRDSASGPGGSR